MTPITHLPATAKPRERLFELGAGALSLEELLAVIVGAGTVGCDVLSLSSSVAKVLRQGEVTAANLATIKGIGKAKAAEIMAALQLGRVVGVARAGCFLADPVDIYHEMADLLGEPREHLAVFFLSVRQEKIAREIVSIGTASASMVHPREVFRPAICHNASQVVVAHTHPSGICQPSRADVESTRMLAQAGSQLGIQLVDHLICSREEYLSLRFSHPELFL